MAPEWDDVTSGDSDYITAISGDLKYLLTMGGSVGASGSFPCSHCVRSRKSMCYRGWIPAEVETMRHLEPKSFHGDSQLRSHPVDEKCEHDVDAGTCFCIDKGAEYIQEYVDTVHEQDCEDFQVTDQHAPFHAAVIKLTRDNTYSIVAPPLLKHVPLALRFPGIWHCCHNTRQMLWIMIKDAAAVYGVIPALQEGMQAIGLQCIKVAATNKPRKEVNMEAWISEENQAAQKRAVDEEAKNDRCQYAGMDGKEVAIVMHNFGVIQGFLARAVTPAYKNQLDRWGASVRQALNAFDAGAAIALADVWATNRATEMGEHFRTFADAIANISKGCGLPYLSREYLAILPIHWLCEPDHLQAHASNLYETWGIAPGSGTDGTTEMVIITRKYE